MAGESKYDQCAKECNGCSTCMPYSQQETPLALASLDELRAELRKRENAETETKIKQLESEIERLKKDLR